ncbi:MAG: isoprenylcysteine carboxylmethyltransferase family protein [Anaerolineae bacterium]|nr:isoprenylcysteine carboxylmethyltransferase family protein [Anaerolineae bacterium]
MKDTPPTYFFICVLVAAIPYFFFVQYNIIPFPFNWLGLGPLVMGLGLNYLATRELEKYNTPHNFSPARTLVRSGVFGFSRNPIYLGMILGLGGIAILFQNPLSLLAPIFFYLVIEFKFIPFEEQKMTVEIGAPYLQYKQSIRKWL